MFTDGQSTYTQDAADQTTSIKPQSGVTTSYAYDGDGNCVSKTVGSVRTDYWYDDSGLTLETKPDNSSVIYLRDPDGNLLSRLDGSTLLDYATDRIGDVTGLTGSDDTLKNTYSYRPYGDMNSSTGSEYNPYQYISSYQDSDTGKYQKKSGYYLIHMENLYTGYTATYDPSSNNYDGTRAEAIAERPWDGSKYTNLANFGTAYFSFNRVNVDDPSHGIGTYSNNKLTMYASGDTLATPSLLSNGGENFYVQQNHCI